MISYLLQAISTTIFGPIFAIVIMYFELKNGRLSGLYSMIFEAAIDVADTVLKTNLFVSFSVGIAGVIRNTQSPPLGERTLLEILSMFQGMITFGFYCSSLAYGGSFMFKYGFYQLSIVVSLFVGIFIAALPSLQTDTLEGVMTWCALERNYTPAVPRIMYGLMLAVGGSFFVALLLSAVLFGFFKNLIRAARSQLRRFLSTNSTSYLHISPPSKFLRVGLLLGVACWMWIIISLMIGVERARQELQIASGSPNQDSQWGFGQVIAVVSWAPVLYEMLVKAIGSCY